MHPMLLAVITLVGIAVLTIGTLVGLPMGQMLLFSVLGGIVYGGLALFFDWMCEVVRPGGIRSPWWGGIVFLAFQALLGLCVRGAL